MCVCVCGCVCVGGGLGSDAFQPSDKHFYSTDTHTLGAEIHCGATSRLVEAGLACLPGSQIRLDVCCTSNQLPGSKIAF